MPDNLIDLPAGQPAEDAPAVQPEGQGQPVVDAPDVQPEGQGGGATETGLYDLSTVPEDQRGFVEPILKDIERNANAKFQQHAEYRKSWEPYEALGLHEYEPEGIGNLLKLAEALEEDPRAAVLGLAEIFGVDLAADAVPEDDDPVSDLRAQIEELQGKLTEREQRELDEAQRAQDAERIQAEWAEVQKLHGRDFTDKEVERLRSLATEYLKAGNETPIKAAYEFINGLVGQAQADFVTGAPSQPAAAQPGGRASTTAQPVDDFAEAERLLRERRQQRAAVAAA